MAETDPKRVIKPLPGDTGLEPTVFPGDLPPPVSDQATVCAGDSNLPSLRPGQNIAGFEVLRELGRGSFACVYLARQTALDRRVALKVSADSGSEARTLAALEHDHIVRVFSEETDRSRNLRLMCMQYVSGTTLARVIDRLHARPHADLAGQVILDLVDMLDADPVPLDLAALRDRERLAGLDLPGAACWYGIRLAEALAYAHARGVLHRDVKPANILINRYGRPLLADFNVAAGPRSGGSVGGTLAYMAPEHLDAFNPDNYTPAGAIDARSDIYSLGVVLFELLTGRLPFEITAGGPVGEMLQEAADRRRLGPPSLDTSVPAMLARVLAKCLAGRPADRYASAGDLAADLASCQRMLWVRDELPPGYVVTPLAIRSPFLAGAALMVLPHVLATAANIAYNAARIRLSEPQREAFGTVTICYNLAVYPVVVGLYLRQVAPLLRIWRRLAALGPVDEASVESARRRALQLPWWNLGLAALGWLLGGIVFPLSLHLRAGPLPMEEAGHFVVSFAVAGLIAMTYSVLAVEFVVVRVVYPGLWLHARAMSERAATELRPVEQRLVAWQLLAVLIPMAGAALMMAVGPETFAASEYRTFRLLVTGLLGVGMVGLGLALLAAGMLRRTIAVLTASEPSRRRVPPPSTRSR